MSPPIHDAEAIYQRCLETHHLQINQYKKSLSKPLMDVQRSSRSRGILGGRVRSRTKSQRKRDQGIHEHGRKRPISLEEVAIKNMISELETAKECTNESLFQPREPHPLLPFA
mmetsp:Transcript_4984/g.7308  ORF Transcript_4984/g.7308 Transcript_4984/m.7308 type:complete len:113 (-) Transcript_4984:159-497(-)|eukprot:CAMPEP_0116021474 /NCGR_PEP_ID=MMETSP0321-20121206/10409_1 /TAXON_ID=163516 /ORGANISM="Leptocylindrus danicus var. danicus, Strain B650" /LENGTH=112 /DNA_ID=CAMNT_0003492353 /DNA_START=179 /DNA_END=517 /DNA_ORIENTATION=+